jgi:hypothetical protein
MVVSWPALDAVGFDDVAVLAALLSQSFPVVRISGKSAVCAENFIRIDPEAESRNVEPL